MADGDTIDWQSIGAWDGYGHYCATIYGGYGFMVDGIMKFTSQARHNPSASLIYICGMWRSSAGISIQANVVANEIRDPGCPLPKTIKADMLVVLISFERSNITDHIFVPWDRLG